MTIKDIARLSGVSTSTVSKIMNGKADGITPETTERVLNTIKEYNYKPYEGIRSAQSTRSFLVGVLIDGSALRQGFLTGILETARRLGYSTIVCTSKKPEEEYKSLLMMLRHHVDGVLWEPLGASDPQCAAELAKSGIPVVAVGDGAGSASFDFQRVGYLAMEALMKCKHRHVLCLTDFGGGKYDRFRAGCEQCMFDYQTPVDGLVYRSMDAGEPGELVPFTVTGVVCSSAGLASRVLEEANRTNRRIPKYLSVVCLDDSEGDESRLPGVTQVRLPYGELGERVCRRLVSLIENTGEEESIAVAYRLTEGETVDVPITLRSKKILVVGTLNMDTLISIGSVPRTGQTSKATRRATMPGGKGINQATAAARLGAEVYLIGKMGKDYDGSKLFNFLKQNNVNTDGLLSTARSDTGHAYISVQEDGESSIVIYEGANGCLTCEEIERQARLFENASFCLLQTEMTMDLVTFTAEMARGHGCKVMLKPSVLSYLDERLLRSVDILVPNEREINTLCPGIDSFEEKAQFFLDRGVGTVIITLGSKGGYYRTKGLSGYFAAADFTPVDTTGAADVFCAALAVYLSQNYGLVDSIRHANVAAGYSTTYYGAAPRFLVDKETLDFMVDAQAPGE